MEFIRSLLFWQSNGASAGNASFAPSAPGDPSPYNTNTAGAAASATTAAPQDTKPAVIAHTPASHSPLAPTTPPHLTDVPSTSGHTTHAPITPAQTPPSSTTPAHAPPDHPTLASTVPTTTIPTHAIPSTTIPASTTTAPTIFAHTTTKHTTSAHTTPTVTTPAAVTTSHTTSVPTTRTHTTSARTTSARTTPSRTTPSLTTPTYKNCGDNTTARTEDVLPVSDAPPTETAPRSYPGVAIDRTDGLVTEREPFNRFNILPADSHRSRLQSSSLNKNIPDASRANNTSAQSGVRSRPLLRMFDPPLDEFGCPMSNIGVPDSMFSRPFSVLRYGRPTSMCTPGRRSSVPLSERPTSIRPSQHFSPVRYSFGGRAGRRPPIREPTEVRLNRLSGRHSFRIPEHMQTPRPSSMQVGAPGVAGIPAHVRSLAARGDRSSGAALNPPRANTPPPFERRVIERLDDMRKSFDRNPLGSVVKRKMDDNVPDNLSIAKRRRLSGEFGAAGGQSATPGTPSAAVGQSSVGGTARNNAKDSNTLSAEQRAAERASRLPIAWRKDGSKVIYTGFGMGKRRSRKSVLSKLDKTTLEKDVKTPSEVPGQNFWGRKGRQ